MLGDLRGRGAHPAANGMDQDPLTRLQPPTRDQSIVCREEGLGDRGRFSERQVRRHRQRFVLVDHDELGLGATADQAHHPVAHLPSSAATHRFDLAGVLEARNVGRPA
jgi:hypothetical protein